MRFSNTVPEGAALRAAPLRRQRLGFETSRSTALVIDRENIDMIGTNHVVGPIRKPVDPSTTYAIVLDGMDLGFPPQSLKASIERAQENLSESFLPRLVPGVGFVDVEFGSEPKG
jgi:hypothetical protein